MQAGTGGVRLVEQAGDRAFIGDAADRLGEQRGDRQQADLLGLGHRRRGTNRIGDDQLGQRRAIDPRNRYRYQLTPNGYEAGRSIDAPKV